MSDLFASAPNTDEFDLEDMLLQVMGDEYQCQLEDGSEMALAKEIVRLRGECSQGRFEEVDALYRRWEEGRRRPGGVCLLYTSPSPRD